MICAEGGESNDISPRFDMPKCLMLKGKEKTRMIKKKLITDLTVVAFIVGLVQMQFTPLSVFSQLATEEESSLSNIPVIPSRNTRVITIGLNMLLCLTAQNLP